jgi:hypothetical protein
MIGTVVSDLYPHGNNREGVRRWIKEDIGDFPTGKMIAALGAV